MLRHILLYLSEAGWMRAIMAHFFLARRVALRFVAGETLEEAIATTKKLNEQGLLVSLDFLGESVHSEADTKPVVAMYQSLLEHITKDNLNASISLKLTHLGLDISEDLCVSNVESLLTVAQSNNIPVTIDMEASDYTDVTLKIFRDLKTEFPVVGTVIQSMLRRSKDDMKALATEGARIRLCKGAYLEPASIAYPDKADVDGAYISIADDYLLAGPPAMLEMATHDENMIAAALKTVKEHNIPSENYEFQMLYGIRSARQLELAQAGYQMRVYVPFGTSWYPYFMRRLAERPANLWFFARSLFRS